MGFQGVKSFTSEVGEYVDGQRLFLGGDGRALLAGHEFSRLSEQPRGPWSRSTVVEAWRVVSDQRLLPGGPCSPQRVLAELVHRRGWSDPLRNVTTPVMALDEHPARIVARRRQPRVPDVGDEERNIARFGNQGYRTAAIPLQIAVGQVIERWRLS